MVIFIWLLNFGISILNAIGCGVVWDASKAKGGWAHFMTWMGAVMSACGFTSCYLLIIGFIGSNIPAQVIAGKGEQLSGFLISGDTLQAFYELGYVMIIFPIIGSGLAITVNSWRELALRRAQNQAGALDYAVTGWNTFAQIDNMYNAYRDLPGVFEHLGSFFGGGSSSKKDNKMLVIALVVAAVLSGVLTTASIIRSVRQFVRRNSIAV